MGSRSDLDRIYRADLDRDSFAWPKYHLCETTARTRRAADLNPSLLHGCYDRCFIVYGLQPLKDWCFIVYGLQPLKDWCFIEYGLQPLKDWCFIVYGLQPRKDWWNKDRCFIVYGLQPRKDRCFHCVQSTTQSTRGLRRYNRGSSGGGGGSSFHSPRFEYKVCYQSRLWRHELQKRNRSKNVDGSNR